MVTRNFYLEYHTITYMHHRILILIFAFAFFLPKATFGATLSFGARGQAVFTLQSQLISLKYLSADSATGYFGALTRAAVRAFQCKELSLCSRTESSSQS